MNVADDQVLASISAVLIVAKISTTSTFHMMSKEPFMYITHKSIMR